jgi:hypothetical protein
MVGSTPKILLYSARSRGNHGAASASSGEWRILREDPCITTRNHRLNGDAWR